MIHPGIRAESSKNFKKEGFNSLSGETDSSFTIKSSLFQLGKHVSVGQSHLRFNLFVEANSPCNQEHKTKTLFLSWT